MTEATLRAGVPPAANTPSFEEQIHARAWAMVQGVVDSELERLALLHAASMLKVSMALCQPDPHSACGVYLAEHYNETLELLQTSIVVRDGGH